MISWSLPREDEIVLHLETAELRMITGSVEALLPRFLDDYLDTVLGLDLEEFTAIAQRLRVLREDSEREG